MMGRSSQDQEQLFYSFNLEEVVPATLSKPCLYPAELRDQLRNFASGYFLGTDFRSLNIPLYSIPWRIW